MTVTYNLHVGLTGWTGPFGYVVGNRVVNSGNAYQCITAGTSASGAGPTTTASNITDGSVHWKWLSAVDFTSLSAAAAALPNPFTQPIIWLLWNNGTISIPGANVPYLTLTGHGTTPTNNLTITCAPGESIRDSLKTGQVALAFNAAAGVSITLPTTAPGFHVDFFSIFDANVIIDGLQFKDPNAVGSPIGCSILAANPSAINFFLRNCIIDCTAQANMAQVGFYGTPYTVANCLFVDRQPVAGGQIAIKADTLGTFVNNTHIGINSPTGTYAILSNYNIKPSPFSSAFSSDFGNGAAPLSPIIVRNTACFGYTGIGVAVVSVGAIAVDHSATSGGSIGANVTDSGGNFVSQSAATTFLSTTTDFRLILGASSANAAAIDTVDIPAADDIARTPRTVWDIGAFELVSLQIRGSAIAKGSAVPGTSVPARGISQARARALLTISVKPTGRGAAQASGGVVALLNIGGGGRPWMSGFSTAAGQSGMTAILAMAGRGTTRAFAKPPTLFATSVLVARTCTKANAAGVVTGSLGLGAKGLSNGRGRSIVAAATAPSATARSSTSGRSVVQYIAALSARGLASASARLSNAVSGYRTMGRSAASGLGLAVYLAPPTRVNLAISAAFGRAGFTRLALLTASGSSVSSSLTVFGDQQIALLARGASGATGQCINLQQDAVLLAQVLAKSTGAGLVGVALPIQAHAGAANTGRGIAIYTAFLNSRGSARIQGGFTPATLASAGIRSVGTSVSKGKSTARRDAFLSTGGLAIGSSTAMLGIAMPLRGSGTATLIGQIGSVASQRLSTLGAASGRGSAAVQGAALQVLRGYGSAIGRVSGLVLSIGLIGNGVSIARSTASVVASRSLAALGKSLIRSIITPLFTVALSATGGAVGMARSRAISQRAQLTANAPSGASGQFALSDTTAAMISRGMAKGSAAAGEVSFGPVALTAIGMARGFGRSDMDPDQLLAGSGIGLSEGRCRTIATVLLQGSGRSRAQGIMAAAGAVGFVAKGRADARGYLYSALTILARGRATASGTALIAGLYNVIPDTQSPTLSALSRLPAFDSMDFGDTDFFSFDWSSRMSAIRDPIVSATVVSVPPGLSMGPVMFSGTIVQVRCGSTTRVETFSLRCSVTLRSGRTLHWSAPVSVEDF